MHFRMSSIERPILTLQRNPVSSNPGKLQLEVHHFKMTNVLAASDATVNLWLQISLLFSGPQKRECGHTDAFPFW